MRTNVPKKQKKKEPIKKEQIPLVPGDRVTFGEHHTKGLVIGTAKDGRLRLEVWERWESSRGPCKIKYIFLIPKGMARKDVPKEADNKQAAN